MRRRKRRRRRRRNKTKETKKGGAHLILVVLWEIKRGIKTKIRAHHGRKRKKEVLWMLLSPPHRWAKKKENKGEKERRGHKGYITVKKTQFVLTLFVVVVICCDSWLLL